jgi:tetratricopeptide (TPR) repeat protein
MRLVARTPVYLLAVILAGTAATVFLPIPAAAQRTDAPKKAAPTPPQTTTPAAEAAPATDTTPAAAPGAPGPSPEVKEQFDKGEAAIKAGDFNAAITAFNAAGDLASKRDSFDARAQSLAQVGRARALAGLKEYNAALNDLNSVLIEDNKNVPALVARGALKLASGKPTAADDAVVDFENAVKNDPNNIDAQLGYGQCLVSLRRGNEAIQPLTRVIAADPKNGDAYRYRGTAYTGMFNTKKAVEDFKQAVTINPEDFEAYFTWGMLDAANEDRPSAADHFLKAIEHFKPKPGEEDLPYVSGYLHYSNALVELGKVAKTPAEQKADYQKAIEAAQHVIGQLDPKNTAHAPVFAESLYSRGVAERMLGDLTGAIRTFTQAITYYPDLADAYFRRGICFLLIGEEKMAITDFQASAHLAFEVRDPRANLWEGFAYAKLGNYHEALRAYGDAIAASDRYTPAYYNRGLTYMMLGEYKKAIDDFNESIRLEPTNAEYYFKRGLAYQVTGDNQKASESYATAITFDGKHAGAYRHMADVMQALGRNELVTQYRQKADQLAAQKKSQ